MYQTEQAEMASYMKKVVEQAAAVECDDPCLRSSPVPAMCRRGRKDFDTTLALVPYWGGYGGAAHSAVEPKLKLDMLRATVCAAARYFEHVVIGACTDFPREWYAKRTDAEVLDGLSFTFPVWHVKIRCNRGTHLISQIQRFVQRKLWNNTTEADRENGGEPGDASTAFSERLGPEVTAEMTSSDSAVAQDIPWQEIDFVYYTEADQLLQVRSRGLLRAILRLLRSDPSAKYVSPNRLFEFYGAGGHECHPAGAWDGRTLGDCNYCLMASTVTAPMT